MSEDAEAPPFRPPDGRMIPSWRAASGPDLDGSPPARHRRARDDTTDGFDGFDGVEGMDGWGAGTADSDDEPAVRPFVLTGGRTRAGDGLRLETLLQTMPGVLPANLRFESARIVEVCRTPASIADISAAMRVPLGVVRVLVADLVAIGHITVVRSETLSTQTLERIRDRVRSL